MSISWLMFLVLKVLVEGVLLSNYHLNSSNLPLLIPTPHFQKQFCQVVCSLDEEQVSNFTRQSYILYSYNDCQYQLQLYLLANSRKSHQLISLSTVIMITNKVFSPRRICLSFLFLKFAVCRQYNALFIYKRL